MTKNTNNKNLQDMVKEIMQNHELRTDTDQNKIHKVVHYTSIDALISMLENTRCQCNTDPESSQHDYFRIYNAENFNDPTEGKYLFQNPRNQKESNLQQLMLGYGHDPITYGNSVYIGSFIDMTGNPQEHPQDDLVMWTRYGADGQGVSMEITVPAKLLYKVKYGREQSDKTAEKLSYPVSEKLQMLESLKDKSKILWGKVDIINPILGIGYLYKHEAYQHENECRIIEMPPETHGHDPYDNRDIEHKNATFRSYLNIQALSVCKTHGIFQRGSSITIGPTVDNAKDAKRHIEKLIAKAELAVNVKISEVPYRKSRNK